MKLRLLLLAIPALLAAGSCALAQTAVYRCTDAGGKVAYQAQPCADAGSRVDLPSSPAAPRAERPAVRQRSAGAQAWSLPFDVPDDRRGAAPAPAPAATPAPPPGVAVRPPPGVTVVAPRELAPASTPAGAERWGRDADVIVVSAYEFSAGETKVHLNHPARPVLLVLTSYQNTRWKVLPAPGTRLRGIVVASNENSSTVLAPPEVPVANDQLPYAIETGNLNFRELLGKLHARYGISGVTGFRGGYRLPELVPVSDPFVPDANLSLEGIRPEVARVKMAFDLISTDGRRLPWTNSGPKDGKRYTGIVRGTGMLAGAAVVREDGGEAYALEGNGSTLKWFPRGLGGPSEKVPMDKDLPELSWGSGMAWDARSGVLALVSFGGEGYFYRYDTRKHQWLGARSLQNRDLFGLALNAATGGYVSVSERAELVLFNARGELEEVHPLMDLLPDLGSTYDRGNGRLAGLTVAAQGDVVALVNVRNATVTHIWTYELGRRKAQLTYKVVD
ncbi:DUF4124 domain-containing protein [Pelomonas sp. KK5]|uniref:DUF4124 domain-containing protein n=1 Tax=Pelomonas sp. KK5 TaxID=1855730 RepID=UPI001301EA37|nr:DUF4124 domain-containing protein [Pelomonas sp. KK5]